MRKACTAVDLITPPHVMVIVVKPVRMVDGIITGHSLLVKRILINSNGTGAEESL